MKCPSCEKEGAYIRNKVVEGKRTKEKELYCRLCNTISELKNEPKKQ